MKSVVAIDRYTKALFQMAEARSVSDDSLSELRALSDFFAENSHAVALFDSPVINKSEKRAIARKLFAANEHSIIKNFLLVLIEKNRADLWTGIAKRFAELLNERKKIAEATIVAARTISDDLIQKIRRLLESRTQKTIHCKVKVDPELIGGIQIRLGHYLIDGTIRTQLNELRRKLCAIHAH